ncbi:MAG: exported protein of unknown function [Candidatus Saccharibacteria bacterium]|nr:exported protein of unknown function [Candidatus Saccharibacteria bacterium]
MTTKSLKLVRDIAIGSVVLVILAIALGVLYIWYTGQQGAQVADAATASEEVSPAYAAPNVQPKKPSADAQIGASVQMLTSPVAPGKNASITVRTLPEATCTIEVSYNDVISKDSGLSKKVADVYGLVSWSWTVDNTAAIGEWPVKVTCSLGETRSAVVVGKLTVSAK